MALYPKCAGLLRSFVQHFMPTWWAENQQELGLIHPWPALDEFCSWVSGMRKAFPLTMTRLYKQLNYDIDLLPRVLSPRGTDWTFTVHVIRYVFLQVVSKDTKELFENRDLSMKLLDEMEQELIKTERSRTPPPHAERRGRDTPEPDRRPNVLFMLARLRDFIE
jgi:hypothetical protein